MLEKVKRAKHLTTNAYDEEILDLIEAAKLDLDVVGVNAQKIDALLEQAIITYCLSKFGSPSNYDQLKASYDEQKAQLQGSSKYAKWGDGDGEG